MCGLDESTWQASMVSSMEGQSRRLEVEEGGELPPWLTFSKSRRSWRGRRRFCVSFVMFSQNHRCISAPD
ncbi:unnamed protein product [Rhodiola kirilowii]